MWSSVVRESPVEEESHAAWLTSVHAHRVQRRKVLLRSLCFCVIHYRTEAFARCSKSDTTYACLGRCIRNGNGTTTSRGGQEK